MNRESNFAGEIRVLRFPETDLVKIADALDFAVLFRSSVISFEDH
jgi:hypothetical protein